MPRLVNTTYQTDAGNIFPIRVGLPTAELATNAPPGGAATEFRHAVIVSTSARSFGLRPRRLNLKRSIGVVGVGDAAREVFDTAHPVVLTPAAFNALVGAGGTVEYAGEEWTVNGGLPEN